MKRSLLIMIAAAVLGISGLYLAYNTGAAGSTLAGSTLAGSNLAGSNLDGRPQCLEITSATSLDKYGESTVTTRINNHCARSFRRVQAEFVREQVDSPAPGSKAPRLIVSTEALAPGASAELATLPKNEDESYRLGDVRAY
jgi:hypothetical protein